MSLNTVQIWQAIQAGEIASAADCRQWASEVLAAAGTEALDKPQLMMAQLVKLGHLTPFQANTLLSDDPQTLIIGRHRLLAPLASPALKDWFEALDPTSNAMRWLYAISQDRLKEPALDQHPPSVKLARQHVAVQAAGLQNFSSPALIDGYLLIAATPAEGQPLREALKSYPKRSMPTEFAIRIVERVATALAALHRAGIVHGRVGIDQVWWDGQEEITLLRDPFFPPVTPLGPTVPTAVGIDDDQDNRFRYAAPEFTVPGQAPTYSSDVYALGCFWWELIMGQAPYADTMMDRVPTAASKFPLKIPNESGLSSGQRRCLEHMLAKNPSSRFANCDQLLAAWEVVNSKHPPSNPSVISDANLPKPTSRNETKPVEVKEVKPVEAKEVKRKVVAEVKAVETENLKTPRSTNPIAAVSVTRPNIAKTETHTDNAVKPVQTGLQELAKLPVSPTNSLRQGTRRPIKKKTNRPAWFLPAMLGGCGLVLACLVLILNWSGRSTPPIAKSNTQSSNPQSDGDQKTIAKAAPASTSKSSNIATKERVVDPLEDQFILAKNDSSSPWLPPRASQPYSLTMLPPGGQGFIFIRPKNWLGTSAGQTIVKSLAETIDSFWKPIEKATGVSINSVDELAIGLYPSPGDGWPRLVYRLQWNEAQSSLAMPRDFPNATKQSVDEKNPIFVMGEQAIYLRPKSDANGSSGNMLTIGPLALIRELAEIEGGGAPLRRQMEQLWQVSDARSDLSVLVNTGYFFSDARNVLPSISPRLQTICRELLDEKTQALLLTTTIEPQWYGEVRIVGPTQDDASHFIKELQERMKAAPDAVEAELVAVPASPYWRSLAARFPHMLRALARYQRYGIENGQAISNFYLPASASANLSIASWMAIQSPVLTSVAANPNAPNQTSQTKAIGSSIELLELPVSINFEQEPLDSALSLIAEEVNRSLPTGSISMTLAIDGKAFELASVTRNQQIRDFRFAKEPLRVLLTDLAKRINPDRTVKSLDEAKQAVVWIAEDTDGKAKIQFTTRRGIEGTTLKLPSEFLPPP